MLTRLDAYKHIAAIATLEKWYATAALNKSGRYRLASRAFGIVWHDRYLCEDMRVSGRPDSAQQEGGE